MSSLRFKAVEEAFKKKALMCCTSFKIYFRLLRKICFTKSAMAKVSFERHYEGIEKCN